MIEKLKKRPHKTEHYRFFLKKVEMQFTDVKHNS